MAEAGMETPDGALRCAVGSRTPECAYLPRTALRFAMMAAEFSVRWAATALLFVASTSGLVLEAGPVSFNRDVLPILSDNCFACHGPDAKQVRGGLRLDQRSAATTAAKSGAIAVVPGKPDGSVLIQRVESTNAEEQMPPPESRRKLTPAQKEILRRWIAEGAAYEAHWSLIPPRRPPLPEVAGAKASVRNPIDRFVLARLEKEGMSPSPEAAKATLIRRVSLDLTGLPPSVDEVATFLSDTAPDAYEKVVARLLQSEFFGERMAMWWLDAARYSDTDGYQADDTRANWPWRDWVVAAFNRDMRYDEFTIEQFAGDLLPEATREQVLATCFHRNHMTNGEGGRDPEESRVDYVIDRVNTMGTVWLGLTLNCCQCHSHKFDPISQADYYRLSAFFNNIDEDGKAGRGAKPYLAYESPHAGRAVKEVQGLVGERRPREARARAAAEAPFAAWLDARWKEVRTGHSTWRPLTAAALESVEGTQLSQGADGAVQASGPNPNHEDYRIIGPVALPRVTGLRLEVLPHESNTGGGLSRGRSGEFILTDIKVQVRRPGASQVRDVLVANAVADGSAEQKEARQYGDIKGVLDDDPRNGWTTKGLDPKQRRVAVFALAEPLFLESGEELIFEMRHRSTQGDANIGRFRISVTDEPGEAVRSVEKPPLEQLAAAGLTNLAQISPALRGRLFDQFLADHGPYQVEKAALDRALRQLGEATNAAGRLDVMVLAERPERRPTHVLVRGVWDKHGEEVARDVPAAVAPWPANEETTRLGLARWLVSRANPLTARVMVNHLWQLVFGAGLVRTPEDFGLQGERPSHPELLDWLAEEFVDSGWSVKHMLQLMVTSGTYRQSSVVSEALLARDPDNRLLARGARFRLPSWMLRDAALRSSGLLNPAVGGPPVRPYQPDGVWEENFMGRFHYLPSEGAAQHRRTLYAFWRRSIAPTFLFDSAQRRVCEVRIPRTNTPLQALTLLNDANYLEASRALAVRMLAAGPDTRDRLVELYRRVVSRTPEDRELAILQRELERAEGHYRKHPDDAARFLGGGQFQPGAAWTPAEVAAHAVVASLVLNLDEAITHE